MPVHRTEEALGKLGIDAPTWEGLAPKTRALIERACLEKVPYSQRGAMSAAERIKADGDRVAPYRCPFRGSHWHVGHPPSMETVRDLALAVRDLHGTAPTTRVDNP